MQAEKVAHWTHYIITDDEVLLGKPTIKNTRISVEFILERLANGWTEEDILENYPRLSKIALQAVFAYVHECMRDGLLYISTPKAA